MYGSLQPGDVVLADALFDNYFLICELRERGIDVVARAQYERVGSQVLRARPDGEILVWQRPNKPHGMTGEQYRRYPKSLPMRQVSVDARDKDNRAEQFQVITTILDASIDGGQIGDLYERRWDGEVCQADDIPRCGLYPSARSPHSERGGAAATWPAGARGAVATSEGRLPCEATTNDQSPPPTGGLTRRVPPRPPLAGAAGDGPARGAHGPRPDGDPGPATAPGRAGGGA